MKPRWEIQNLLLTDLNRAREHYEVTRGTFSEVMREIPSGLPQPDGIERIRIASLDKADSFSAYFKAVNELNEFLIRGTVPERYRARD